MVYQPFILYRELFWVGIQAPDIFGGCRLLADESISNPGEKNFTGSPGSWAEVKRRPTRK
jgi:hypothetical protein